MNNHFDSGSLKRFVGELEREGFVRVEEAAPSEVWRGEIHPAFDGLTDAESMAIRIRDGWPFQSPMLFVQGLETSHLTQDGFVCMWRDGDGSLEWETLRGFRKRIEEWCSQAKSGWLDDGGLQEDAYLNFRLKAPNVATFDWKALGVSAGAWGEAHGVRDAKTRRVDIKPGAKPRQANLAKVLWFHAGILENHPPRSLAEVESRLSRRQRKGLRRALDSRGKPQELIILFCWELDGIPSILPILTTGFGEKPEGYVMIPGPNDERNLILRAGPDAAALRERRATLFGAGALGGYVAVILAQSGLGFLDIVDRDALLPGNVARHIAGHRSVGLEKVEAVRAVVKERAPWTNVRIYAEAPSAPTEIRRRMEDSDLAIDSTGSGAFANSLGFMARETKKPVVSGALYRGGAVGRVRRYALPNDQPIHQREESRRYPAIPPGNREDEFASPETGCSAPVNNAPPASVAACASLTAQVAIDALTERFEYDDEVIDVYFPLDKPPFDRIGRVSADAELP